MFQRVVINRSADNKLILDPRTSSDSEYVKQKAQGQGFRCLPEDCAQGRATRQGELESTIISLEC